MKIDFDADFDKADNLWLSLALDDTKRKETLKKKQNVRKFTLFMALIALTAMSLSIALSLVISFRQGKFDEGSAALKLLVFYMMMYGFEKLDSDIKLLKLAGALRAEQQTNKDTESP